MATPYKVEVVTPDGPAFRGEAEMVVVPGTAGELGILAHHAPLISSLKPGRMSLTDAEGERMEWATAEGFIEVRKNEALVLVSEAVRREEIDAGEARARLEQARAALERAQSGDGDVFRAQREEKFAEALVAVAEG
jgi:F-type H+-transporting ATPase subunit epsilon